MTYKRKDRHFWHAAPSTAIVATLAMVGAFLAPSISPASAATTTTTTTTTAPTTTTRPRRPPRPHSGAWFKLLRGGERDGPRPHRLVGHHQRSL